MKNELKINSDKNNVYADFSLKASRIGVFILGIMIIILIGLFFGLLSTSDPRDLKTMLLPIIFILALIVFAVRYLLWNIYGQEFLVINPKSISYSRNYGFFKTKLNTILFDEMSIFPFSIDMKDVDEPIGKLHFYNIVPDTKLRELKLESSIAVPVSELEKLMDQISSLFQQDNIRSQGFYGNSAN